MGKFNFALGTVEASKGADGEGGESGVLSSAASAASKFIGEAIDVIMPKNLVNMRSSVAVTDPVGDMIMFGNNLLTTASYALLTIWGMKALADAAGRSIGELVGLGGLSSIAESASSWLSYAILMMILVGLMHSFVLPMLPMIMVFTMGVSWLVMMLEGSIAGVMWAFVFIRMDGQDFLDQKQSPGAGLLFNLLLRPALGMLAFCGMLLLLPALLNTLNLVWGQAFSMQTGNQSWTMVWVWQWVASLVMFCWMQWTMTLRITGLIPTIADRVGHWMGMSSSSGYGDAQETSANIGAMVAAAAAIQKAPIMGAGGRKGPPPPPPPPGPDKSGNKSSQGRNGQNRFKK